MEAASPLGVEMSSVGSPVASPESKKLSSLAANSSVRVRSGTNRLAEKVMSPSHAVRHRNSQQLEEALTKFKLFDQVSSSITDDNTDVWKVASRLEVRKEVYQRALLWITMYISFLVPWLMAFEKDVSKGFSRSVYIADIAFLFNFLNTLREYRILTNTTRLSGFKIPVMISGGFFNCCPFLALMYLCYGTIEPRSFLGVVFLIQCPCRLYSCMQNSAFIHTAPNSTKFSAVIFQLMKTILAMFMLLHMAACSWIVVCNRHCVGFLEVFKSKSYDDALAEIDASNIYDHCWFKDNEAYELQLRRIYEDESGGTSGFYMKTLFLTTSMVIGAENINPGSRGEALFGFCALLVGVAFTAVFFGQTMSLIHSLERRNFLFRKKLEDSRDIMEHINLPRRVKDKVNRYFWYKYSNFAYQGMAAFLEDLSEPLAMEVQLACHASVIGNIAIFQDCSASVIRMVLLSMTPEIFLPGDTIFRAGDIADKLYMIQSGAVEILNEAGEVLVELKEGSYFGEVALLTDFNRTAGARSSVYTTCDTLSKSDFDNIRERNPVFNERLTRDIAKNYIFNEKTDFGHKDQPKASLKTSTDTDMKEEKGETNERLSKERKSTQKRSLKTRLSEMVGVAVKRDREEREVKDHGTSGTLEEVNNPIVRPRMTLHTPQALSKTGSKLAHEPTLSVTDEAAVKRAVANAVKEEMEGLKHWLRQALKQQHPEKEQHHAEKEQHHAEKEQHHAEKEQHVGKKQQVEKKQHVEKEQPTENVSTSTSKVIIPNSLSAADEAAETSSVKNEVEHGGKHDN